jgi:hypothetical protein
MHHFVPPSDSSKLSLFTVPLTLPAEFRASRQRLCVEEYGCAQAEEQAIPREQFKKRIAVGCLVVQKVV